MHRLTAAAVGLVCAVAGGACSGQAGPVTDESAVQPTTASVAATGEEPTSAHTLRLTPQDTNVAHGRIAWAEVGSGDPLVLLNGTASPMAEWDPSLLVALSRSRRVLVLDYPGLGGSTRLPGRLTFDRLADSVSQWLSAIGIDRADVMGWSMGTFVSQRMAVRHPDVVDRLVLIAGNPGGSRTTLGPRWVQRADSDPNYTTRTYLRTNYPNTTCAQSAGRAFLRRQSAAVESGRFPADRVPESTYDAMVRAENPWMRSDRNARQLARVSAPTLVAVAVDDVITPPPNSRQLADLVPGAALHRFTGGGHSVLFQAPERIASDVEDFLAGDVPAGERRTLPTNCS